MKRELANPHRFSPLADEQDRAPLAPPANSAARNCLNYLSAAKSQRNFGFHILDSAGGILLHKITDNAPSKKQDTDG
jgi:hypothetical protein